MGHKRKDTISQKPVEWGKHLKPYEKNQVARSERRAARRWIKQEVTTADMMGM